MLRGKPGIIRVRQIHEKTIEIRDFDAEEWSHQWVKRGDVDVLRLLHDRDPETSDSYDFVEFSTPVNISFEYEG